MKIKTPYYGVFVKRNGKWSKSPSYGEFHTKEDFIHNSGLEDENASYEEHLEAYLKGVRKYLKKPIKLLRQVWQEE